VTRAVKQRLSTPITRWLWIPRSGEKAGAKHLVVVSSMGANANSPFFYNKVKGKMEAALIAQKWEHLTIVRPSMLLGHRDKRRFNESIFAPLFRICPVTGNQLMRGMSRVRC
jgi:uncharacterized protein YbjT (DUF2867 family)